MTNIKKAELTLKIDIVGVDLDIFSWDSLSDHVFNEVGTQLHGWGALQDTKYVLRVVELKEDTK